MEIMWTLQWYQEQQRSATTCLNWNIWQIHQMWSHAMHNNSPILVCVWFWFEKVMKLIFDKMKWIGSSAGITWQFIEVNVLYVQWQTQTATCQLQQFIVTGPTANWQQISTNIFSATLTVSNPYAEALRIFDSATSLEGIPTSVSNGKCLVWFGSYEEN